MRIQKQNNCPVGSCFIVRFLLFAKFSPALLMKATCFAGGGFFWLQLLGCATVYSPATTDAAVCVLPATSVSQDSLYAGIQPEV